MLQSKVTALNNLSGCCGGDGYGYGYEYSSYTNTENATSGDEGNEEDDQTSETSETINIIEKREVIFSDVIAAKTLLYTDENGSKLYKVDVDHFADGTWLSSTFYYKAEGDSVANLLISWKSVKIPTLVKIEILTYSGKYKGDVIDGNGSSTTRLYYSDGTYKDTIVTPVENAPFGRYKGEFVAPTVSSAELFKTSSFSSKFISVWKNIKEFFGAD